MGREEAASRGPDHGGGITWGWDHVVGIRWMGSGGVASRGGVRGGGPTHGKLEDTRIVEFWCRLLLVDELPQVSK